jgi:hypothetical protein
VTAAGIVAGALFLLLLGAGLATAVLIVLLRWVPGLAARLDIGPIACCAQQPAEASAPPVVAPRFGPSDRPTF